MVLHYYLNNTLVYCKQTKILSDLANTDFMNQNFYFVHGLSSFRGVVSF